MVEQGLYLRNKDLIIGKILQTRNYLLIDAKNRIPHTPAYKIKLLINPTQSADKSRTIKGGVPMKNHRLGVSVR